MKETFLFQALIYLLAAVVVVPIAKRLGLGAVLGYLLAGILIGPSVMHLVGSDGQVMNFAEFGVVMMLFLIGLELRPTLLWRLRVPILGLGGLQVASVGAAVFGVAMLCNQQWKPALAVALILPMSSTAIVLQSLAERNQLKLSGGQSCFSVLLFQDISVIPILALLSLLGNSAMMAESAHGWTAHLVAWQRTLVTLGAIVVLVGSGRFILGYVFRFVAASRLREVFTELTLLLVVGITLLMEAVGLSAALGAFVAGVVLSDSEYRHQLEADIEPFKGILLGLFFISVGVGIDFELIASRPILIAGLVIGLMLLKSSIQLVLGKAFGLGWSQSFLFSLALAQGGEFCFVLLNLARNAGVLSPEVTAPLIATVAVTMALTPLLFVVNDRVVQPRFNPLKSKPSQKPDDIPDENNPVILAGFGRFGHVVGRFLRANGIGCTVLDNDPEQVAMLGRFGLKTFFGDAHRMDLLHSAGAAHARIFISTIADEEGSLRLVQSVQKEFPHLRIFARALSRQHAYSLLRIGVENVFRETLGSALDLGVAAMRTLGVRGFQAVRAARIFKEHDEASLRDLAKFVDDDKVYASRVRQHIANLEQVLSSDRQRLSQSTDDAWDIELPKPKD